MECAGHCNGGEHTSVAMQEEVGWLGDREWMAREMDSEKAMRDKYKEMEKSRRMEAPVQKMIDEVYKGNKEVEWAEIAPLPRGGKGKVKNQKRMRTQRDGDGRSKQRTWAMDGECQKSNSEHSAQPRKYSLKRPQRNSNIKREQKALPDHGQKVNLTKKSNEKWDQSAPARNTSERLLPKPKTCMYDVLPDTEIFKRTKDQRTAITHDMEPAHKGSHE